jgi:hypothetical protein
MAANSTLDLVSLDFDTTKDSLKNFLKSQDTFKDFDFEGSNINILLDVLAYNTFLNSFYLNMVASESFLDSAQMRDSVVSHAKELNYLPRSAKSSRASLEPFNIYTNKELTTLVMPKGTRFSGVAKGVSYNFVTDSVYINNTPVYDAVSNSNIFAISKRIEPEDGSPSYIDPNDELVVYQGDYQTDTFVTDYTIENQRFVLSDTSIDTDSITVLVTENSGATALRYVYSSTLLGVKNTDTKFFLQPAELGKYEIVFGDDIIGRRPKNGAVITVEYRVTRGEAGNSVALFTLDTDVVGSSGGTMTDIDTIRSDLDVDGGSYGGANAEDIEAIRYKAPRYFQTQERAVTTSDYQILLQNAFPEIQAISVFGGETFDPPLYGKVYVSVKLKDVDGLPDAKKQEYIKFLEPRSPLSIDAIFVTPENLYLKVTSNVNYNINITSLRPDQIKNSVRNAIISFSTNNLEDFNATLRKSKLTTAIDTASGTDTSIVSNQTDLLIYKKIVPFLGINQNITIRFGIPLIATVPELKSSHPADDIHAITSSSFIYNGQLVRLEDDGGNYIPTEERDDLKPFYGNINLVTVSRGTHSAVKKVGEVNYKTGTIQLYDFNIDSFEGNELRIYALPEFDDISVIGNNIFTLGLDELTVNVRTVRE